ncbi:MAG TPA: DNA-binding response regulator [Ktedonobacter sp.]|jgi:two-component system, NarL family, response regulator YdfI|nr:DNA-binding response regulator [Ktedonobacter sp.]HAT46767.1 DNA-binding response regulator [Ktedonobacter sp.]HBE25597.1 DNA-binding response regulator [Ktedonobacter sp.]HCF86983.1 DNA-binding response regulator [Ktedonobacter sp.]HCJ34913.1 DNA-binding response regulator [Ktedonobacter sp.]
MIRAFVVAPTPMILAGLHAMLTTGEIQVVGESASPAEMIVELPTIDVIVVDHLLLEDVARAIANDSSAGRIALVVLTNSGERPLPTLRTLALRGWGVVPVEATSAELQAVVTAVAQGFVVLPVALSGQFSEPRPVVVGTLNLSSPDEALTNREREVLELVSQGLSNKLIGRRLMISEHTVKFHISAISTKLGASSRTDAVSRGVRRGLITL